MSVDCWASWPGSHPTTSTPSSTQSRQVMVSSQTAREMLSRASTSAHWPISCVGPNTSLGQTIVPSDASARQILCTTHLRTDVASEWWRTSNPCQRYLCKVLGGTQLCWFPRSGTFTCVCTGTLPGKWCHPSLDALAFAVLLCARRICVL